MPKHQDLRKLLGIRILSSDKPEVRNYLCAILAQSGSLGLSPDASDRPISIDENLPKPAMPSIECMSRTAKDIPYLMTHKFLHFHAGRPKVFPRVKLFRILGERFADPGRHGEPKVRVDIHLGATDAPRNFDVRLGHPCRLTA